ncbi:MAG: hypothetical protein CL678_15630 [Bdellovibrionaceae bacterium]|nr:hypothetical protein [Pseudobdellovibrionaceae bacterium]
MFDQMAVKVKEVMARNNIVPVELPNEIIVREDGSNRWVVEGCDLVINFYNEGDELWADDPDSWPNCEVAVVTGLSTYKSFYLKVESTKEDGPGESPLRRNWIGIVRHVMANAMDVSEGVLDVCGTAPYSKRNDYTHKRSQEAVDRIFWGAAISIDIGGGVTLDTHRAADPGNHFAKLEVHLVNRTTDEKIVLYPKMMMPRCCEQMDKGVYTQRLRRMVSMWFDSMVALQDVCSIDVVIKI